MAGRYDDDFGGIRRGGFGTGNETDRLRQQLQETKDQLEHQQATLQRIAAGPTTRGFVVSITGKVAPKALISVSQQLVEVAMPGDTYAKDIGIGSCVRVQVDSLAILGVLDGLDVSGDVATVRTHGKDGECEVDWHGNTRVVRYGLKTIPEPGDRVMVDNTCNVLFRNLGPDLTKFSFQGDTGVCWDDIGGLTQAKEDMKEAIELPSLHADLYKGYGKKPVKGVLLYGPPGCGKTLLAKAASTSLRKARGESASATGFIYVRGPELLDKFVGTTEAQIRSLFARARDHFKKHKYPAMIFIDESDALLGKRGARLNMGMETTVVPQFLSEMDGLDDSGSMILLATNRPDTLDPAVTRDQRIDRKVHVTRPTISDTTDIFRLYLDRVPVTGMTADSMAQKATDFLFSPNYELYEILMKDRSKKSFTLGNLVNGAMIYGMVDNATTSALKRDVTAGNKSPGGVSIADLQMAAEKLYKQNKDTNHETELEEFCAPFEQDWDKIRKPQPRKAIIT